MTPENAWSGGKPTTNHFQIFGCISYAMFQKRRGGSLTKKQKSISLDVSEVSKAYKFFNPQVRKINQ